MGSKIMVVDDDLPTLEVMELLLRKINREPVLVHNGWDALRMIKKEKPALIILDVMMSPIDGWQFLEELKRNEELKDIPVLLFTAKMSGRRSIPGMRRISSVSWRSPSRLPN